MSNKRSYCENVFTCFIISLLFTFISVLWLIYENTSNTYKTTCDTEIIDKIYEYAESEYHKYPTYKFNVSMKCQGFKSFNTVIEVNEDLAIGRKIKYTKTIDLGKGEYAKESVWLFIVMLIITIVSAIYSSILSSGQKVYD